MNPATACARVVVDELVRQGVVEVVLAPGSRSAPLALELAAAAAAGRLRLHVRIDERSAGFLALGLAKAGRSPAAVVCTSGSAVANLGPAVTEAAYAGVPLLLLTADRPAELQRTGANQTIAQAGLFGPLLRAVLDPGVPEERVGAVAAWRSTVARAAALADDPGDPGPVQLNLPFRDPLVPDGDETWPEPLAGRSDADGDPRPWTLDRRRGRAASEPLGDVLGAIGLGSVPARGVVLVGDGADEDMVDAAAALATAAGWPVVSEPGGNARRGPGAVAHASLFLADPAAAADMVPAVVVAVGRVGISRPLLGLLRAADRLVVVAVPGQDRWSDPVRRADVVVAQVPSPPETRPDEAAASWARAWAEADAAAAARVDDVLSSAPGLSGLEVARTLWGLVPAEGLLLVAASRAVRDLDAVAGVRDDPPWVLGNRGSSGIDGLLATAWGAALAHGRRTGGPAFALLGDLAFLYDVGSLVVPQDEPAPDLVVVVCDNDGGGIFGSLEQGAPEHAEHFERVFGTPHGRDLVAVAAAFGWPATRVSDRAGLEAAVDRATAAGGLHIVVASTGERPSEASLQASLRRAGR